MQPELTIPGIAATQRHRNARRTMATLVLFDLLAIPLAIGLRAGPQVVTVLGVAGVGYAMAYALVLSGRHTAGVLLGNATVIVQHIGVVVVLRDLGPIPYLALVVVLVTAATVGSRWLTVAFALAIMTLVCDALLSAWTRIDQGAIGAASFLVALTYVVSMLHVRGTEQAFELAEKRDRALDDATTAARAIEQRHRLIADNTDDLIALLDRSSVALYLSPSHQRVLGWKIDELVGRCLDWAPDARRHGNFTSAFAEALSKGEAHVEGLLSGRDGKDRIFDVRMTRIESADGALVATISRDVTERRQMARRFQASERMEALGRLAGGVAHDFNNLLTVIGSAAVLARRALTERHPAIQDIDAVLGATQTATNLTRQLLTFSRKEPVTATRLDLAAALLRRREILERMIGGKVVLQFDLGANVHPVVMPAAYLEQLAMNLAINARDAMPHGGRLLFSLHERFLTDRQEDELPAGTYVDLSVSDEGTGVPADILPHIFEPFFTTKGEAGTGLGLATCLGIVTQLGGSMTVDTAAGKGSTFRVFLPAAPADSAPSPLVIRVPAASTNDVLVLDDDDAVRETTACMLRSSGHEVWTAATLGEARRILEDQRIALDTVLTDVMLREERGTDLMEHCRTLRPDARIVVMSGNQPDPDAFAMLLAAGARFVLKPFSLEQLLSAFREA